MGAKRPRERVVVRDQATTAAPMAIRGRATIRNSTVETATEAIFTVSGAPCSRAEMYGPGRIVVPPKSGRKSLGYRPEVGALPLESERGLHDLDVSGIHILEGVREP